MASTKLDRQQKIAIAISAGVLLGSAIYWIAQVLGVIEMLRLAYG